LLTDLLPDLVATARSEDARMMSISVRHSDSCFLC